MSKKKSKSRIWELDFLRGFAILVVVFDHFCYAVCYLLAWKDCGVVGLENVHQFCNNWLTGSFRGFIRPGFLFLFFCVSGISSAFSRNNLIRSVKMIIVALIISLSTYALQLLTGEYCFIHFGVIHCFAAITLIYALLELVMNLILDNIGKKKGKVLSDKAKKIIKSCVILCLSAVFFVINHQFNLRLDDVFLEYKAIETNSKLMGMFFYTTNWWKISADYFPIFPFIAIFFFGAGISNLLYSKKKSLLPMMDGVWHTPITWCGRYSIYIYVLGSGIAAGVAMIVSLIVLGSIF